MKISTEIKLLRSLCGESVTDTSLCNHKHDTDAQLAVIGGYCRQLGMSISEMIAIGKQHCLDETEHLLKNLTMYYQLSFEDIMRKICEDTIMTEEQIDSMIDGISLFHHRCDTFYTLCIDDCDINYGNLVRNFLLCEFIDTGTEIEFTEDGKFGYIHGVRYDLANLSREQENKLLLSMLKVATQKLLTEM